MGDSVTAAPTRRVGPLRRELGAFLALVGLCGIAITEPTFALLDRNAQIFAINSASWAQVLAIALAVVVLPPALLYAGEVGVGVIAPSARRFVHAALCGALVGLFAMQFVKRLTTWPPGPLVAAAAIVAVAATLAFLRVRAAREWSAYLSVAPVVFAAIFLVSSPVSEIVIADPEATSPGVPTVGKPHRVVFIVLDELPLGSLLDGSGRIDRDHTFRGRRRIDCRTGRLVRDARDRDRLGVARTGSAGRRREGKGSCDDDRDDPPEAPGPYRCHTQASARSIGSDRGSRS